MISIAGISSLQVIVDSCLRFCRVGFRLRRWHLQTHPKKFDNQRDILLPQRWWLIQNRMGRRDDQSGRDARIDLL